MLMAKLFITWLFYVKIISWLFYVKSLIIHAIKYNLSVMYSHASLLTRHSREINNEQTWNYKFTGQGP